MFDRDILAYRITDFAQPVAKGGFVVRIPAGCVGVQITDHRHPRLLRPRRERPRRRAAKQRDELAPPHSITSSARTRIAVGNTIPKLFAALRLMISSNFVGNSAGSSAGLAPRSTLATRAAP